jgi:RHS repeat-associated protein
MVEEYAYDIFGKPYSINEEGKITKLKKSPVGNTRMYTGREYDRGLKLYYNRARYYDPKLARFISRDPIDIADDVNLYAYVGNNSVMFVDLSGKSKEFMEAHDATKLLLQYMKD